jgi:hypothetical protein
MPQSLKLIHKTSKEVKEVKVGFSWVTLIFGIFVPLVRGYFIFFLVLLGLCFLGGLGLFIAWFICPFFINKNYYNWLLTQGYMPMDEYKKEQESIFKRVLIENITSE